MGQQASFTTSAEAELTCPMCYQFYVPPHDPKHFSKCAHTCCLLCMETKTEGGLRNITCPRCDTVSELPDNGVDGLITGLALRNLAERHPEGIKQHKVHMQANLDKVKDEAVKIVKELHDLEENIHESIKRETDEIEKAVESVVTMSQALVSEIREVNQPKLTKIQEQVAQLEMKIKSIEATQSKLKTIRKDEFISQTETLTGQITKLQITDDPDTQQIGEDNISYKFVAKVELGSIIELQV